MSYALTALGYDVDIGTPFGRQTVSFDLDKVSTDVTAAMMDKGWPLLESRASALIAREREQAFQQADERIASIKRGALMFGAATVLTLLIARWWTAPKTGRRAWGRR